MLRPLLEQAADPIKTNGEIKIPRYLIQTNGAEQVQQEVVLSLPSTAILFKPEVF